ncbi:hypothetical protein OSJ04_21490, partial [Mycobacterium ulcerans]
RGGPQCQCRGQRRERRQRPPGCSVMVGRAVRGGSSDTAASGAGGNGGTAALIGNGGAGGDAGVSFAGMAGPGGNGGDARLIGDGGDGGRGAPGRRRRYGWVAIRAGRIQRGLVGSAARPV